VRKSCSRERENLLKFVAEGREFAIYSITERSEQFLVTECFLKSNIFIHVLEGQEKIKKYSLVVKCRKFHQNCSWRFLISIKLEKL
jgi:hypothetical protein